MNFIKLFDSFDTGTCTEEETEIYMTRKQAFNKMGGLLKRASLAALPLAALTSMPKVAFAQTNSALNALQFALLLERLEYTYYDMGLNAGIVPAEDTALFTAVREHELAHVNLLVTVVNSLGGTPVEQPEFDFTASGTFPNPFENYQIFLALAQAFEDTGVRAYKGQAANLAGDDNVLQTALQIHSLEARHASMIRRLRGQKGWITSTDGIQGYEAATQAVYEGEANTMHLGFDANTVTEVAEDAVREGWDEPLTEQQVNNIAGLFIVE